MISEVELKQIADKVGQETSDKIKTQFENVEKLINEKLVDVNKGLLKETDFEKFKTDTLAPLNETLKGLDAAMTEQGNAIKALVEKAPDGKKKTLEAFLGEQTEQIKAAVEKKAYLEFTGEQLKAAGVYSIAGAIPTASPYAPGIAGGDLDFYEIIRNPNFITSHVNLGNTNQARLAWANELPWYNTVNGGGVAGAVTEGNLKPQTQHRFEIVTSNAKKTAAWAELTEEFDQDLPQFATIARRLLGTDVYRAFDDQIQLDVQAAARAFIITSLNGKIQMANYYDAILAMMAQVGSFNFMTNTVAYNWFTNAIIKSTKNINGSYLTPAFFDEIQAMTVYANKMADYYALVGDLKQYNVDIYKDYLMKVGWINDEFVNNKFAILGEMRYHSYISENRKNAIVYDSLDTVDGLINKA